MPERVTYPLSGVVPARSGTGSLADATPILLSGAAPTHVRSLADATRLLSGAGIGSHDDDPEDYLDYSVEVSEASEVRLLPELWLTVVEMLAKE